MTQKASLLIVEDPRDVTSISRTILSDKGYKVETCIKDGRAVLDSIKIYSPDVVIMDVFMAGLDACATLKRLAALKLLKKPHVIVTANFDNGILQREIIMAGADYFLLKPFDYDVLCDRIDSLLNGDVFVARADTRTPMSEIDLEVTVSEILHRLGVGANLKGYQFLRTAIVMAILDESILGRITKELYPSVAKRHSTTASRVERSMRHAIENAWDRGDIEALEHYFGYIVRSQRGKPTNSEFIAVISDRIRLKIKIA